MLKLSYSYRLIAVLTGFLVMIGISSPASVYAWGEHCGMEMEATAAATSHQGGDMTHHTDQHAAQGHQSDTDCDTGIICDCCATQSVIKVRSANSFNRIKAELPAIVIKLIEPDSQPRVVVTDVPFLEHDTGNASPPIFLKNSTFLN